MNESPDPHLTAARPVSVVDPTSDLSGTVEPTGGSVTPGAHGSAPPTAAGPLPAVPGYRVLRELARGGMGRVLAAHDLTLDREVAIKLLLPGAAPDRFVRESKITARLSHPGIPPVYGLGALADGSPFLAMKLVAGHTLAVERKTAARPRLLQIFTQVCQAVGFAHSKGVIHRDLKPGNVMVGAFGEVQVMDWGLAKELGVPDAVGPPAGVPHFSDADDPDQTVARGSAGESTEDQTQAGSVLGTPAYMAPEQARGEPVTPASDVYGLGAILHALLVGRPPYSGANVADVLKQVATADPPLFTHPDPSVPAPLLAICRKAMARTPAARYPSAEAVAVDVQNWLTGERVSVYREPWTDRVGRWARRRRAGVMTAAGVLVALTVATTVAAVLLWQEKQRTEGEKVTATANGEVALAVVDVLSDHIIQVEYSGNKQSVTDHERKLALDKSLSQYQRLLAIHPDNEKLILTAGHSHRFRANLCRVLNLNNEAEESYQKAINYYSDLKAAHPSTPSYRIDLAVTYRDYSLQQKSLGHLGRSAELLDAPIRLYDEIHAASPDDMENLRKTAIALLDRAELEFQLGQFAGAERNARISADIFVKLAGNAKAVPQPLDPLFHGMAEIRLAVALRELGRLEESLTVHDQVVKRFAPYLGLVSDNTRTYTFEYHRAQAERAVTQSGVPAHRAAAVTDLDAAIAGCEKLVKQFPQFPPYLRSQAAYTLYRGRVKAEAGEREAAAADLSAAAAIFEGLVGKFPDIPVYRSFLGQSYAALGRQDTDPGKSAECLRKARAQLGEAVRLSPENALDRKALADLDPAAKSP